jgi:hypothetical protein
MSRIGTVPGGLPGGVDMPEWVISTGTISNLFIIAFIFEINGYPSRMEAQCEDVKLHHGNSVCSCHCHDVYRCSEKLDEYKCFDFEL